MNHKSILFPKKIHIQLLILLAFLLLKYLEIYRLNMFNGDGPWSLSQTISMLNGDWGWSKFAHELDGPIYQNYAYAFLFYIPFKVFGVTHFSYLSIYFFFLALTVWGIYKIFNKQTTLAFILSLIFVSGVYTYNFRYESLTILLIVWGLFFIFKNNRWMYLGLFLLAWAALIHPATVVALFFLIVHYFYLSNQLLNFKKGFIFVALIGLFMMLLLGFNINNYFDPIFVRPELKERFLVLRPLNILKWFALSSIFAWGVIITLKKIKWFSVLIIALNIGVYFLFKKSYYYPYLILHLLLLIYFYRNDLTLMFAQWVKFGFITHLVIVWGFFFVFPLYKTYENKEYGSMMRRNIEYLKALPDNKVSNSKIYVERELLMGAVNHKNTRMYLELYRDYYVGSPRIDLSNQSKIYLFREEELNKFKKSQPLIIKQEQVTIKEIFPPVKGILTFGGRNGNIGLWEISAKND